MFGKKQNEYDVLIVGGGAAGLSSALYSCRYELKTIVLEGKKPGGYTAVASTIENYPGFKEVDGFELIKKMREQVKVLGAEFSTDKALGIVKKSEGLFEVTTDKGLIKAKSVILAHGSSHRELGLPKEEELLGKGVSICAVCDAPMFKDKNVAVVGGGDSSLKGVLLLSKYAKHIYLITREDKLHGEPINIRRLDGIRNLSILYKNKATEILGEGFVEGLRLKENWQGKKDLDVEGLFVMIGFVPKADYFKGLNIKLDERSYIDVDKFMKTSVPGVMAAGDCTNGSGGFKQTIVAAAQGAMAATSVNEYLAKIL